VVHAVLAAPLPLPNSLQTHTKRIHSPVQARIDAALEGWEQLLARGASPTAADIDTLARKHRILKGKWMFFPRRREADAAWAAASTAVARGAVRGCSSIKISSVSPNDPGHIVCAYVDDYLDETAVVGALEALKIAVPPLADKRAFFKPDIMTYLGIYSGNEFGLRPTLYPAKMR
jgi:hypothetical protein